ncbi:MAG: cell division protein FtsA [Nitrospirae bacterium]|nr:cell division protein FtsA [Nitrospirota bacterium]
MRKKENIIAALDIGTTKICAIAAEVTEGNKLSIKGMGTSPSKGLKKGIIVDIEQTVDSIRKAVQEACKTSGVEIKNVHTGIAGSHILGLNSKGAVPIRNQEVAMGDVEKALETARAIAIPPDREILHVIPQEFIIDGQDGIRNPIGISGVRLEVLVHIITGAITSAQNIIKSVNKAGIDVMDVILQPLASAEAVLTQDEKELGVALIDIGGGTTDMALIINGSVKHTAVIPIGGNYVTNDIAFGVRTPFTEAENLKIKYGCAMKSLIMENGTIEVQDVGGRPPRQLSRHELAGIIQPRAEEIFELAKHEIKKANFFDALCSGIVLTGGSSIMKGLPELAEKITGLPVRLGTPENISGSIANINHPMYSTGIGILLYAIQQEGVDCGNFGNGRMVDNMFKKMKGWFREFF